jgi:hypothetical protein
MVGYPGAGRFIPEKAVAIGDEGCGAVLRWFVTFGWRRSPEHDGTFMLLAVRPAI